MLNNRIADIVQIAIKITSMVCYIEERPEKDTMMELTLLSDYIRKEFTKNQMYGKNNYNTLSDFLSDENMVISIFRKYEEEKNA
ncbi:MAG: hypothetical protein ACRC0G_11290 [Fusobacteriaceae bacterium]